MATKKQAIEATNEEMLDAHAYEFAFHVLPTIAEAEVTGAIESLKTLITKAGGEIFDTEDAKRIELAYEVEKVIEGVHKRYHSAYFGWIRMRMTAEQLSAFKEELVHVPVVLRSLITRLTKDEEAHAFRYHDVVRKAARKGSRTNGDTPADAEVATEEVVEAEEVVDEADKA